LIKLSDYIARRITEIGVRHVFMISGGGAMHLNDSIGRQPGLTYVCNHHEQASAIAAEGYARISGNIGVCVVTSGPGGTNTVTGVLGQWLDSIPALYISGQVRYDTTVSSTGLPLRQLGDQEADIVSIVRPITKYAVMVTDPATIRYHFDRAVHLARSGRPGPVWLDIPLNVQSAVIEEGDLSQYDPSEDEPRWDRGLAVRHVQATLERIRKAERPLFLAGNGIRLAGAVPAFETVVEKLNIPVQTGFGGHDLIPSDHPRFFGRPSVTGDRSSNFIVQNCDLLLCVGTRLGVRQVSYNYRAFARGAYKIVVDIDPNELRKPTIFPDLAVQCDAGFWLEEMARQLGSMRLPEKKEWTGWCRERRRRYPSVLPEYREEKGAVNSYHFVDVLSSLMGPDDIVVLANGTANTCTFQAIRLKKGQRLFTNSGCASMGYDIPAAIGACFAGGGRRVVCIAGDGSIQMNLQELQTIAHHRLPIKMFVLSNDGYLSIRGTQEAFFQGNYVASNAASGVSTPDIVKIATAYGIPARRVDGHEGLEEGIRETLAVAGPALCDLNMSSGQTLYPKVASERLPDGRMVSKPLEDMYPFLDRAEFLGNMIIPPWDPDR
jgi:acetolactate synthase-1/2/3 large subunit